MAKYHRLTHAQRYQIEILIESENSNLQIARKINCSPSTISRELKRNRRGQKYKAKYAVEKTWYRRKSIGPRTKIKGNLLRLVLKYLKKQWSPAQISHELKSKHGMGLAHETIYKYVYARFKTNRALHCNLRRQRPWRKSHSASRKLKNNGKRVNRTWIDERPKIVEKRSRLGDVERDTMEGKKGGSKILTMVDRTSRYSKLEYIAHLNAKDVHQATVKSLKNFKVKTITNDNGPEFAEHKETAKALKAKIYFCQPYSSYQRGTNENTNGLIRQYFPRGVEIDQKRVKEVERLLNSRPRKCLGFKTPAEVHRKLRRKLH